MSAEERRELVAAALLAAALVLVIGGVLSALARPDYSVMSVAGVAVPGRWQLVSESGAGIVPPLLLVALAWLMSTGVAPGQRAEPQQRALIVALAMVLAAVVGVFEVGVCSYALAAQSAQAATTNDTAQNIQLATEAVGGLVLVVTALALLWGAANRGNLWRRVEEAVEEAVDVPEKDDLGGAF